MRASLMLHAGIEHGLERQEREDAAVDRGRELGAHRQPGAAVGLDAAAEADAQAVERQVVIAAPHAAGIDEQSDLILATGDNQPVALLEKDGAALHPVKVFNL